MSINNNKQKRENMKRIFRKKEAPIVLTHRNYKKASKHLNASKINEAYETLWEEDETIFTILHRTGIRISELSEYVRLVAVNPQAKTVRLQPAKNNWERVIPNYLNYHQVADLCDRVSLTTDALKKRISRWNLGFSAHDLRATFITNALNKEISPVKVQALVGHKRLDSTMAYMRHNTENDVWLYDYITQDPSQWTDSNDVKFLKKLLLSYETENAKLRQVIKEGK